MYVFIVVNPPKYFKSVFLPRRLPHRVRTHRALLMVSSRDSLHLVTDKNNNTEQYQYKYR